MNIPSVCRVKLAILLLSTLVVLTAAACGAAAAPTVSPLESAAPVPSSPANDSGSESPGASGKPVQLVVGSVADTYRNDPVDPSQLNIGMFPLNANVFDQLILVDHEFQIQPMLAESWEYLQESGAWRFHLRDNVTFHDGQPFNAPAVVEMVQRYWSQGAGGNRLRIDQNSAEAVDNYTLDLTPVTPNLRLTEELSHSSYGVRAPGSDPTNGEHVGTGPFRFAEYVRDNYLAVEKNQGYWGKAAEVDRIEFRFMPDPNTRILALQSGDVDVIIDVPPEATSLLEDMKEIQVLQTDVSASQYLMMLLTGDPPHDLTQDILVREAVGYAIDRQQIVDNSFDGYAVPSQLFGPPGVLGGYADRIVGYQYDPVRARSLLDQAGWRDGDGNGIREKSGRKLTLEFINGFPAGPENGQTAEVIQSQLQEVGIDLVISNMPDNATYSTRLDNKEGDLFIEIGNQNSPSPCFLASLFYSRYENPGSYARGFAPGPLGWPEYDDEIDGCNSVTTTAEAAMHRANAIHILVDESRSLIPLVGITRIYGARSGVAGFDPHPVRPHVRWNSVSVSK
jgi:peptide/nickel transport system substrate-binding protein